MKQLTNILLLALAIVFSVGIAAAQQNKAEKLYQEGLYQMEGMGDFTKAIEIFNRVVTDFSKEKPVAAKALLHIGMCHEKLGKGEAQKAYERVIKEFADQKEVVKEARARLSALITAAAEPSLTVRQVWAGPDVDNLGAPSPDGRYISYTDWNTGNLAVYEIPTQKRWPLTDNKSWDGSWPENSRWSPDGKKIAYGWWNKDGKNDVRIIGLDSSKPRILTESYPWIILSDWSPDGKHILAVIYTEPRNCLVSLISVADGSIKTLKKREWSDGKMRFSPDGEYIAFNFRSKKGPDSDIYLLSIDGKTEVPLVEHPANDYLLGWTPNGKHLLFASDRTGTFDAWILPLSAGRPQGEPEIIRKNLGYVDPMGITQNGDFYYGFSSGIQNIYVAAVNPETCLSNAPVKKMSLPFEGRNHRVEYSPDGKQIAFVRSSLPRAEINYLQAPNFLCVRSLEDGRERVFPLDIYVYYLRWAPDCSSILVSGMDRERCVGFYRVDVNTGDVSVVLQSKNLQVEGFFLSPEWSDDGKALFYLHYDMINSVCTIVYQNLQTGQSRKIHQLDLKKGPMLTISPDKKWLAVIEQPIKSPTEKYERVIKIIPAEGGEPGELCRFENSKNPMVVPRWSADGRFVLYPRIQSGENLWELWRVPFDGGQPQKVGISSTEVFNISPHPDGRQIAFASPGTTHKESEIWVMENFLPKQELSDRYTTPLTRQVWAGAGVNGSGEPSPDGKYLSIMDSESGDLAIREIETGQTRRLTKKGGWSTAEQVLVSRWSPDGKKIAYAWLNRDLFAELRIIGFDGSEPRILLQNRDVQGAPLDWSPDGKNIVALISRKNISFEIALLSVADGALNTLKTTARPVFRQNLTYSPDGKYIAYDLPQQEGSQERDIFMLSIDGKQEISLVKHPAHDWLLGWVPGSDLVLFGSDRTGTQDAWALHVADGKPQGDPILVRKDIGQITPIGFTDKGSYYYSLEMSMVDAYEASLDLAKGTVVESPKKISQRFVGYNYSPEWSPDGKYLAYVSERRAGSSPQSSYILCLRSDKTGEEREVPLPIQSFWQFHWPADSGAIFATMMDKTERQGLFKIDIQTGKLALIAQRGSESLIKNFAVSPDGKSVFYAHFQWAKKLVMIIRHDLETGQEKEVYRKAIPPDIFGLTFSPDGKYLSFSTSDIWPLGNQGYVIRIMPSAGGEIRDILQGKLGTFTSHAWTRDGKVILFVKGKELWQIPAEGGEPKKINIDIELRDVRLHPDGRRIAFTSGKTSKEIWVMENFLSR